MRSTREAIAVFDSSNNHARPTRQVGDRDLEPTLTFGREAMAVRTREPRVRGGADIMRQLLNAEARFQLDSERVKRIWQM